MSAILRWRTVTPSTSPKFLVRGTELNVALCGDLSRFQLCEIRVYSVANGHDRRYDVRDAHAISDADVKEGKRPPVVASFSDYDAALQFVCGA